MRIILLLFVLVASPVSAAQLFKCIQADGTIAFQQVDCPKDAEQSKVTVMDSEQVSESRIGASKVAAVAALYPEILETPTATQIVVDRRNVLIAEGVAPELALRLAAAEYAADRRAGRGNYVPTESPPQQSPFQTRQQRERELAQEDSGKVECTDHKGNVTIHLGSCPAGATGYRSRGVMVMNPQTGQVSPGVAQMPYQRQQYERRLNNHEACQRQRDLRSSYEKNRDKILNSGERACP